MDTRLGLLTTMVALVCFGVGMTIGGSTRKSASLPTAQSAESGPAVTALAKGPSGERAEAFSKLARSQEMSLLTKYQGYLRLIAEAGVDEIPELLRQVAQEIPSEMGGDELVEMLTRRWLSEDPKGVLAALIAHDPSVLQSVRHLVIGATVEADAGGVWETVCNEVSGALTNTTHRGELVSLVLNEIAASNPDKAIAMMLAQPDGGQFPKEFASALELIAETDPSSALEALVQLRLTERRGSDLFGGIIEALATKSPDDAIARLGGLPPKAKVEAISRIASAWAKTDPGGGDGLGAHPVHPREPIARHGGGARKHRTR